MSMNKKPYKPLEPQSKTPEQTASLTKPLPPGSSKAEIVAYNKALSDAMPPDWGKKLAQQFCDNLNRNVKAGVKTP